MFRSILIECHIQSTKAKQMHIGIRRPLVLETLSENNAYLANQKFFLYAK